MKITIDAQLCSGHARCAATALDVSERGTATYDGATACPDEAITGE